MKRVMLSIYRLKTESRRSRTYVSSRREWQYIKEKLTCCRYCPIKRKFIIIGWRWAGNSPFGYSTEESAKRWGLESLCKQKEEFILIGGGCLT